MSLMYLEIGCGKYFVMADGPATRWATTSWWVYRFACRSHELPKEVLLTSGYAPSL
jgi:hypothetical protein